MIQGNKNRLQFLNAATTQCDYIQKELPKLFKAVLNTKARV